MQRFDSAMLRMPRQSSLISLRHNPIMREGPQRAQDIVTALTGTIKRLRDLTR